MGVWWRTDYPFWKYVKRPVPQYDEIEEIKARTPNAKYAAFKIRASTGVEGGGNVADRVKYVWSVARLHNISTLRN